MLGGKCDVYCYYPVVTFQGGYTYTFYYELGPEEFKFDMIGNQQFIGNQGLQGYYGYYGYPDFGCRWHLEDQIQNSPYYGPTYYQGNLVGAVGPTYCTAFAGSVCCDTDAPVRTSKRSAHAPRLPASAKPDFVKSQKIASRSRRRRNLEKTHPEQLKKSQRKAGLLGMKGPKVKGTTNPFTWGKKEPAQMPAQKKN
jgi:hypothetical protein